MKSNILVYCGKSGNKKRWMVKKSENERASYGFDSKIEAMRKAEKMAKNAKSHLLEKATQGTIKKDINFDTIKSSRALHVRKQKNFWSIFNEDSNQAVHRFSRKKDAINKAKDIAKRLSSVMIVHKNNGQIQLLKDMRKAHHYE